MIRTRVGYAGGTTRDPTYYNLGDHTETVQIDYDPVEISYEELLDVFWSAHNPVAPAPSRQYASMIYYHDPEQKRLAAESLEREAATRGQLYTAIVPYAGFTLAEDYHQKYNLQHDQMLKEALTAIYPDPSDFIDSTSAARVNGYVGHYGTAEQLQAEIDLLGLPPAARDHLLQIVSR